MADVIIGATQTADTKQSLIDSMVQKELKGTAVLAQYFTDVSRFAVKGMKSISFPALGSFTAAERSSGSTLDAQAISDSVDTLQLNVPAYLKWIIDSNDEVQSTLNWELECIARAASAHGRLFESKMLAVVTAEAAQTAARAAISKAQIKEMRLYLKKNMADLKRTRLFVSPEDYDVLLGIDEFVKADINGETRALADGVVGRVYGIPVVELDLLASEEYFMAEEGAICYGFQKAPAIGEQPNIDTGVGSVKKAMDALYGMKGLQIGNGPSVQASKSPLMIKNKDAA
jgi:hypothetical protein